MLFPTIYNLATFDNLKILVNMGPVLEDARACPGRPGHAFEAPQAELKSLPSHLSKSTKKSLTE